MSTALLLFAIFAPLSLLAVGGLIPLLPEIQRLLVVEHGLLSAREFAEAFALAQAAPGPNILSVGLMGWRIAGAAGLLAALGGMLLPAAVLAWLVGGWLSRNAERPGVKAFRSGLVPLALGLFVAGGGLLAASVAEGWIASAIVAASSVVVWRGWLHPLAVLGLGAASGALLF
jgi:chromate transporter